MSQNHATKHQPHKPREPALSGEHRKRPQTTQPRQPREPAFVKFPLKNFTPILGNLALAAAFFVTFLCWSKKVNNIAANAAPNKRFVFVFNLAIEHASGGSARAERFFALRVWRFQRLAGGGEKSFF